jgi:hypothetical protein
LPSTWQAIITSLDDKHLHHTTLMYVEREEIENARDAFKAEVAAAAKGNLPARNVTGSLLASQTMPIRLWRKRYFLRQQLGFTDCA